MLMPPPSLLRLALEGAWSPISASLPAACTSLKQSGPGPHHTHIHNALSMNPLLSCLLRTTGCPRRSSHPTLCP